MTGRPYLDVISMRSPLFSFRRARCLPFGGVCVHFHLPLPSSSPALSFTFYKVVLQSGSVLDGGGWARREGAMGQGILPILGLTFGVGLLRYVGAVEIHAFFYLWYGNIATDGGYRHWNHELLPHWDASVRARYPETFSFEPPELLHSPYYPQRGCYSSRSRRDLEGQFEEMKSAGISVAVLSWWGRPDAPSTHDTQGVNTDDVIPIALEAAAAAGIKIAFHLEPYSGRDIANVAQDVEYIVRKYGNHRALFTSPLSVGEERSGPAFYVYDSYHIPEGEWARLLTPSGDLSVRGTEYDGVFIGLWLDRGHGQWIKNAGFDGAYTYFAARGFSYGSTIQNWPSMSDFMGASGLLFIPSVGPGYDDTRIRPW